MAEQQHLVPFEYKQQPDVFRIEKHGSSLHELIVDALQQLCPHGRFTAYERRPNHDGFVKHITPQRFAYLWTAYGSNERELSFIDCKDYAHYALLKGWLYADVRLDGAALSFIARLAMEHPKVATRAAMCNIIEWAILFQPFLHQPVLPCVMVDGVLFLSVPLRLLAASTSLAEHRIRRSERIATGQALYALGALPRDILDVVCQYVCQVIPRCT